MSYTLPEILNSRSKEEIEATLDYFNELPLRRGRKQDMVKRLSAYLSNPKVWLEKLMEPDLRLLQKLCKAGPDKFVDMIPGDFPSVVEVLRLVETGDSDSEDYIRIGISSIFYNLIAKDIDGVISRKEQDGSFELEHLILGIVNFYGAVPLRTFVSCICDDYTDLALLGHLIKLIKEHPIIRMYQENYRGETYLVSPYVENFDALMQKRRSACKGIRRYPEIRREAAESCGIDSPFCFYGKDTPEGKALVDLLYCIGYEGDALLAVAHSVWINAQFEPDDNNTGMLLYPVTSVIDEIPTFELFREYVDVILAYANKVPKWLLKGRSAEETGMMRYSASDSYLESLYGHEMSESESEALMKLFDSVHRVRPAGPDDPCPCGSGFSYRFCHGRHVS